MEHACCIYIFFAPLESIKFGLLKLKERYITHCIIFDKYRLSHIFSLYKLFKTIFLNMPQFSEMPLEVFWFTYQSVLKHNMKFLAMLVKSRSSVRLVLFSVTCQCLCTRTCCGDMLFIFISVFWMTELKLLCL